MNLKNLGKVYTVDSENNFDLQKDKKLSEDVVNFVNIILDYFCKVVCIEIHSAYLRGSCLEENVINRNILDIDMIIVCENEFSRSKGYLTAECISGIMEIMKSTCGFAVYPDIEVHSIDYFLSQTQIRFICKKVYGEEDLSISKMSQSEMLDWVNINHDRWIDKCKEHVKKVFDLYTYKSKYRFNHVTLRSAIKYFFRNLSIKLFLEKGQYTRSLYNCYNMMREYHPNHRNDLDDIINLFLHSEEYSKGKILEDLNKILSFLESVHQKNHII